MIMGYINVGARIKYNGANVATKTALRAALSQDPTAIEFYGTSPFTPFQGTACDIQLGDSLTVTGPDPYTARKWGANITKDADQNIIMDGKKIKPVSS